MKTESQDPGAAMQPPVAAAGTGVRVATAMMAAFVVVKLALHFTVTAVTPYELHRDELLYLGMGEHLRFWCMDFPPAIAVLARAARWLFGDTLFAVRFFPAVAGALLLVFTGLIAREFGGGRAAQGLAMLTTFCGPLFLRPSVLFQPVVWDQLWWTVGFYALARLGKENGTRWWVWLGVAAGFGLLTKFSILFFGFAVLVAVLVSKQRGWLLTGGPWMAAGIALAVGSASIVGQLRLGLPVLIHMSNLQQQQLSRVTYADFLGGQAWMLGPALALALAGWAWLLFATRATPFRVIGLACSAAFLLLMGLHGKAYYIGPIYPTLFAAGAVWLTSLPGKAGRLGVAGAALVLVAAGTISLPFGLPILPPESMARFAQKMGSKAAVTTNRGSVLALPQDYADMLGWEDQVQAVARVFKTLPRQQQRQTGLIARNYGEAGALDFYGPRHGLPRRIMLPDDFRLWPADDGCKTVVTLGIKPKDLERYFRSVKLVLYYDNPWRVKEERNVPICIADEPIAPISDAWRKP